MDDTLVDVTLSELIDQVNEKELGGLLADQIAIDIDSQLAVLTEEDLREFWSILTFLGKGDGSMNLTLLEFLLGYPTFTEYLQDFLNPTPIQERDPWE